MAMMKCKECGNQVSTKAKACPACGAKIPKKVGVLGWLFVIVVVLPVAWQLGTSIENVPSSTPTPSTEGRSAPAVSKSASTPPATEWTTYNTKDDMTDAPIKILTLRSTNSTAFNFPYNQPGGSHLSLIFRKTGNDTDALLSIDKGQMLCGYDSCSFALRVADGDVQNWTALESSTHKSDVIFIRDARQLQDIVKQGKPIRIGVNFFQSGMRSFDFNTAGYPGL